MKGLCTVGWIVGTNADETDHQVNFSEEIEEREFGDQISRPKQTKRL